MPPIRHARQRKIQAINKLLFLSSITEILSTPVEKTPKHNSSLQGEKWVAELLAGNPTVFLEETRMALPIFRRLLRWIGINGRLKRQRNSSMSIEQMVVIFLWMVGHNSSNRDAQTRFQHSGRTITRVFHRVLHALLPLYDDFVKPPPDETAAALHC